MNYKTLTTFSLIFGIAFSAFAGGIQQIQPTQIPVGTPSVVNFKQLADYELAHPHKFKKKARFIEQGEDKDQNFVFVPKTVAPGAPTFNIQPPAANQRAVKNSPAVTTSFLGVQDNGTLIPPDIRGAAGPNYVMQTTNQEFKIYTKTGTLNSTVSITNFFSASGGSGYFDPHILYDNTNSRWVVCIDGNASNGHGGLFVAVSQTSDPTGSWYVYGFDAAGNTTDFIDYPLLGYNTNWVVLTANDFLGGNNPVTKVYVMNRASLYSGTLGTISTFTDNNAFTLAPAQTYDASQTTEYLVQDYNGNSGGSGFMQISTITGTASTPVYTAGATIGVTSPWSETQVQAKQSGSTKTFDNGDTRVGNAVYSNGSLWFCHTVFLPAASPTRSSVDWWQINPATTTVQQYGRVDDATGKNFYFYPSINVNSAGDFMLGYCQSSSTTFASAAYAFHAASDAANTLQTPVTYKTGLASYFKDFGSGRNRYGDYTGMAVDPSNNSFWNFSEYPGTGNNWGTVICNVPASSTVVACNTVTGQTSSAITNSTATISWTAASGATNYNIQYRVVGTNTWTAATTTATTYNLTGLTAGSNYEWQVQTVCASGSSAFTASATFTTTNVTPCNTPTGEATSGITTSGATFAWAAATGATSYNVQYRVVGTTTWSATTTTSTSVTVASLLSGSNYEWQVQTVCTSGSSAYSASTTFTTTGTATCNVATSEATSAITSTTATFTWAAATGATSYKVQYRVVGTTTWTSATATSTTYNASGLTAASNYEWQVQTVCTSGSSAFSASTTFTTTAATLTYCTSKGGTSYEYINKVALGTISNTSGNNSGYGNYTSLSTNLAGGTSNTISLNAGFVSGSYREYWTVYIDYNHNGVFTDAGETVVTANGTGTATVSKAFTVPTTALNGPTRMRVQMQYNSQQTNPCATYTYGEVEDYTVNITGNAHSVVLAGNEGNTSATAGTDNSPINNIKLYPNPAQDNLTIEYVSSLEGKVRVNVYNMVGQKVMFTESSCVEGANSMNLNTTDLEKGVFIFEIETEGKAQREKFMIVK